jgi:hypothetical protein
VDIAEEQGTALIDALEAVLRPLLPLFRNYGLSHVDLSQMLGRLFVYDSAETLSREGRPTSVPRLAIMNGLTRGEVEKHLSDREASTRRRALKTSQLMTPAIVLSAWNTDSRFSTPYGAAIDLSLESGGPRRSFANLVDAAAPEADAEAVLDQLVAAGCVEIVEKTFVRCTNWAYIPAGVSVERIARIGSVMGALAATFTHNLLESVDAGGYLERQVQSNFPVSKQGRLELRKWLVDEGTKFLTNIDAWMTENRKTLEGSEGRRAGVEIFMFDAKSEESEASDIRPAANG